MHVRQRIQITDCSLHRIEEDENEQYTAEQWHKPKAFGKFWQDEKLNRERHASRIGKSDTNFLGNEAETTVIARTSGPNRKQFYARQTCMRSLCYTNNACELILTIVENRLVRKEAISQADS